MTIDLSKPAIRHLASFIGAVVVILGSIWSIGKPMAEDFIEQIVVAGEYAKSRDVRTLNRNIEETEQRVRGLESKADKAQTKLENIEKLQQRLLDELIKRREDR